MSIALGQPLELENSRVTDEVVIGDASFRITFDVNKPTQRYIHQWLQSGECYEKKSTFAIVRALKPGDVFFDVGANCGWFSCVASALGARVVAFEPDASNCSDLCDNCPAVTLVQAAVSDRTGQTDLYVNLDNDGGHALWPCGVHPHNVATRENSNPTRTTPTIRLDDYAERTEQFPVVIKIDTEGAECNVLLGAEAVLANPALRLVVCEKHTMGLKLLGHSSDEIEAIMQRHGFKWEQPPETGNEVQNWIFIR